MNADIGDTNSRGSRKKRGLRVWAAALGALLVLLFFLPALLAGPLKSLVLGAVDIPGRLTADRLSLGWFSGPAVDGLALADPEGAPVLRAEHIEMPDASLLSLLLGGRDLGRVRVVKPLFSLEQDADGGTNLERALGRAEPVEPESRPQPERDSKPARVPADLAVNVILEEARLTYKGPDLAPIDAEADRFETRLSVAEGAVAVMETAIRQGASRGSLSLDLKIEGLFDRSGVITPASARITGKARAIDLPVEAVDRIAALDGKLLMALGPELDLDFQTDLRQQGSKAVGPVALKLDAARLEGAFAGRITPQGLVSEGENRFRFTLLPELVALPPMDPGQALPLPQLSAPAQLTLALTDLSLPSEGLAAASFSLHVRAKEIETRGSGPDYQFNWQDPGIEVFKRADSTDVMMQMVAGLTSQAIGAAQTIDGSLAMRNRVTGLFTAGETVPELHMQIQGKGFPAGFVDEFMALDGLIPDLVGDVMDLNLNGILDANSRGTIFVEADSPLAKVQFPARLGRDLTLQRQSTSAFAVTPKLSKRLVEKVLPVIGILTSAKPVELSLQPERFRVPLEGFAFEGIDLVARLSLGEVVLDDGAPLFELLRSLPGVSPPKAYAASFSPFDIGLAGGVVSFQRIHLKTGGLEFDFGGSVDLVQEQVFIDMRLPGKTLTTLIPKLEGLVDPGDSFTIPVKGSLDAPRFDKDAFLEGLKPLLIQAGVRGLLGGEEEEKDGLGDLLDLLGGKKNKQKQEDESGN